MIDLFNVDCYEYIRDLPANSSFDAIITDPPCSYPFGQLTPFEKFTCQKIYIWSATANFPYWQADASKWTRYGYPDAVFGRVYALACACDNPGFTTVYGRGPYDALPIQLALDIVGTFMYLGESVFDPFCGWGAIGMACKKLGVNYIGCDIEPRRLEIARRRIERIRE